MCPLEVNEPHWEIAAVITHSGRFTGPAFRYIAAAFRYIAAAFRFTAVIFKPRSFRYALAVVHISAAILQPAASAAASHSLLWPITIQCRFTTLMRLLTAPQSQHSYLCCSWCCVAKSTSMLGCCSHQGRDGGNILLSYSK